MRFSGAVEVTRRDRIINDEIRNRFEVEQLQVKIEKHLSWFAHLAMMQ